MDPQKLSQLDPKLREAYQRVMGTSIPTPPPMPDPTPAPAPQPEPSTIPTPPVQPPTPVPQPPPTGGPTPESSMPEPPVFEPQPAIPQPESIPTPQASNFVQMNSEVPAAPAANTPNFSAPVQTQTVAIEKKSGVMIPILFGIAGLVFIAIYTLFWTKIFNFKLPFLP